MLKLVMLTGVCSSLFVFPSCVVGGSKVGSSSVVMAIRHLGFFLVTKLIKSILLNSNFFTIVASLGTESEGPKLSQSTVSLSDLEMVKKILPLNSQNKNFKLQVFVKFFLFGSLAVPLRADASCMSVNPSWWASIAQFSKPEDDRKFFLLRELDFKRNQLCWHLIVGNRVPILIVSIRRSNLLNISALSGGSGWSTKIENDDGEDSN